MFKKHVLRLNFIVMFNNNRVVWTYWSGGPMSSTRAKAYDHIISKNSKCEVKLVTEETFVQYEIDHSPIPKEFYLLSSSHQSDYARSYLIHHYGGVYSDVKPYNFDCAAVLIQLHKEINCWGIGYPYRKQELRSLKRFHGIDDKENGDSYLGGGWFAYKSNTDFTKKWLETNDYTLKKKSTSLISNPGTYHPRAITHGIFRQDSNDLNVYPKGYPFKWGEFIANYQLAQKNYLDHFKPVLAPTHFTIDKYR